MRLSEQGGTSSVRAKALLAAQHECSHAFLLITFSEKRLPLVLAKLIETKLFQEQDHQRPSSAGPSGSSSTVYPVNAAISFVAFLREHSLKALEELQLQLRALTKHNGKSFFVALDGTTQGGVRGHTTNENPTNLGFGTSSSSPGIHEYSERRLNSAADKIRSESRSEARSFGQNTYASPSAMEAKEAENDIQRPLNLHSVHALVEILKAVSNYCSKSQIRQFILISSTNFLGAFTHLLDDLHLARQALRNMRSVASARQFVDDTLLADCHVVLAEVDRVVVMLLECITQIDLHQHLAVANNYGFQGIQETGENADLFARSLSTLLATTAATLIHHEDGAVRVIAAIALRKCFPPTMAYLGANVDDPVLGDTIFGYPISQLFSVLPVMLQDGAPVPQYCLRLLTDLTAMMGMVKGGTGHARNTSVEAK